MTAIDTAHGQILTADGTPLKVSLERSLRRARLRAVVLISPALLFLLVVFVIPIAILLFRSVDDRAINEVLPRTFVQYEQWDRVELPGEAMFEAMYLDITEAEGIALGRASTRMNYAKSGWRSTIKKSAREFKKFEGPPYKEAMIAVNKRWATSSSGNPSVP